MHHNKITFYKYFDSMMFVFVRFIYGIRSFEFLLDIILNIIIFAKFSAAMLYPGIFGKGTKFKVWLRDFWYTIENGVLLVERYKKIQPVLVTDAIVSSDHYIGIEWC